MTVECSRLGSVRVGSDPCRSEHDQPGLNNYIYSILIFCLLNWILVPDKPPSVEFAF